MSQFCLSIFVFLTLTSLVSACKNCEQNGNHNSCHGKRSVRAASNQVQELLVTFDVKLTEEMANEISAMSASEKQSFQQDLIKMNQAAEAEYKSLRAKGSLSKQEIIQQVSDKVSQDFSDKKWFKRLQSLAGDKITALVNNDSGNDI